MTTLHIDLPNSPLLAGASRRRPQMRRWMAQFRRLTLPPRQSMTPSNRVLEFMPEARSLQR